MPTYDYKCINCDKVIEVFHSMNDTSKQYCPYCNHELYKKITTVQSPIYKGEGWTIPKKPS